MSTRILLAPVGAGKTEGVLERLVGTLDDQPFAKVWALLATKRQEDAFRQRLVEWNSGRRVFFNVEFFNFYELYQRLLDTAGQAQQELSESARYALLREIIASLRDELEIYGRIAHMTGFVGVVGDFIYELKQSRITPDLLQGAASSPKDRDLALIYATYQETLQEYNLVDREGEGWLAVAALKADPVLAGDLSLLVVDGFDQFTPVQVDLLALLAERADDALITLTTVQNREGTVGRRFTQALDALRERFGESVIEESRLPDAATDGRHPDLRYLVDNIFLRNSSSHPTSGAIKLIEAPDPAAEVGAVLRQVKALLLEGVQPDDILIALRDWERYQAHFSSLAKKYDLPLALHYGEPLAENPAIIALMNILQLHALNFRRRELIDTLRAPYFVADGLHSEHVDLLERISQDFIITGGRDLWLRTIQEAAQDRIDKEEGQEEPSLMDGNTAEQLSRSLENFFALVTPPETATVSEYVRWVDQLIGADTLHAPDEEEEAESDPGLRMIERLRDDSTPEDIVARDLTAMSAFKNVLHGLLTAQALLNSLHGAAEPEVSWDDFYTELLRGIAGTSINPRPARAQRVLVTTATDARGLPHRHVFVLGLSEGLFPAQMAEDPLYLDGERRALQKAGVSLRTQAERTADDSLFYELICLPSETLALSRPTVEEGKPWLPSHLWRAAADVFGDSEALIRQDRIGIGQVVQVDQAATRDEAAVATAEGLSDPMKFNDSVQRVHAWLCTNQAAYWGHIAIGRQIEMGRLSTALSDHYSGRLRDERLIAQVARTLGPDYRWSASQLNDYGMCAFRFFAKRLLKLETLEEPEEGIDVLQRGTLNHAILEETYRRLRDQGLPIDPEHEGMALTILHNVADEIFAAAPTTFGFRASALWEQEQQIILRQLEQMVQLDFLPDQKSPIGKKFGGTARKPYRLEARFGFDEDVIINLGNDRLKVRGFIDRIDEQAGSAIIIDYKSGSTKIPTREMEDGRNFQMLAYLEGTRAILERDTDPDAPSNIAGGVFWHISDQKTSGDIRLDSAGQMSINKAKAHLADYLAQARRGDFSVNPSKPENGRCIRYCEFHQFCRMSSTNRDKE